MQRKFKRVWLSKTHLFKRTFSNLSLQFIMLQKHSDKLYSKCYNIFKAYLIMRCRVNFVNFVFTHFSYSPVAKSGFSESPWHWLHMGFYFISCSCGYRRTQKAKLALPKCWANFFMMRWRCRVSHNIKKTCKKWSNCPNITLFSLILK